MYDIKVLEPIVFEDQEIRRTEDGRVSVFNLIEVVGGQKNPHEVWKRIKTDYPSIALKCELFKFPGRGQRDTPVVDRVTAFEILGILEGSINLSCERDIEDWFVKQYEVNARQFVLPSGKRIDVVLKNGTPCEIKKGQADLKALRQLLGYMDELNVTQGWLVAKSFSDAVYKDVALLKSESFIIVKLVTPDGFDFVPEDLSNWFSSSREYREQAAHLMLQYWETPEKLAKAAIAKVEDREKLEDILSEVQQRYLSKYHPLFNEVRDLISSGYADEGLLIVGQKTTQACITLNTLNTKTVLGKRPKAVVEDRGGKNARSKLSVQEYNKFSMLQDAQLIALQRRSESGKASELHDICKATANKFTDFIDSL